MSLQVGLTTDRTPCSQFDFLKSKLSNLQDAKDFTNFINNLESNGFVKASSNFAEFYYNFRTGETVMVTPQAYALETNITYTNGNLQHTVNMRRDIDGNLVGKPYSGSIETTCCGGRLYNYTYNTDGSIHLDHSPAIIF